MRLVLPLVLGAVAAVAQTPTGNLVPARFDCAIDGTVVDSVTHAPVPRAKIALIWPGGNRSAAADVSGRWSFSGIACARIAVSARRFGYLDSGPIGSPPLNFLLSPDSPAHIVIELTAQATVTGSVTDENGDPVSGMRVVSYVSRVLEGRRQLANAPQAVTNDIGQFRIAPLEPGRYTICAEPAMGQADYQETCYPAPLEAGAVAAMRLGAGDESDVDFALTRTSPVRVSGTLAGVSLGTRITVLLSRAGGMRAQPSMAAEVSSDGKFAFPAVPPGSWMATATQEMQDNHRLFARMRVEIGNSDVNGLVLSLEPTITITGNVRIESQSAAGDEQARMQLSLLPTERNSGVISIAFGDDDRSFTITGVTPGTYRLRASAPGYFLKSARLGGRDIGHGEFAIDAAPGPLEIVVSDNGGSLEGDVTMDDGSPAQSASIILLREGEFVRVASVTNGHFNVGNLEPGAYSVSAWDSIRNVEYADPTWMRQNAGASAAASVEAGQDARIKLTRQTAPLE